MKKFVCGLMAAVMLACAIPTSAFAAEYYMDLEAVDDKTYQDASVDLVMDINGEKTILYRDGRTQKPDGTIIDETDLGSAILFRYSPNGKDDFSQSTLNVTYVPIRRIALALSAYGVKIDWDDETKNVVLDTAKGRLVFPIGATSITANGTTFSEETYKFPNGDPINIVSSRLGRTFVTVRFLSSLLIDNCTFSWKGTERLTVTGTMEKAATTEKTYGVNMNYYNPGNGSMDWSSMPNLMAALEGKDWAIPNLDRPGLFQEGVFVYSKGSVSGASLALAITYFYDSTGINKVLKISGFDYTEGYVDQLPVIDGALKDLICDADRESINGLLNQISDTMKVGWTPNEGTTQEARDWRASFQKSYTLNEVTVQFNEYLKEFTIITK